MGMDKKQLILVLIGLFMGLVLVDADHLLLDTNGFPHISNLNCIWQGFLSLTSPQAMSCRVNMEFGTAYLHDWRVGLFLLGFTITYMVVMKNE